MPCKEALAPCSVCAPSHCSLRRGEGGGSGRGGGEREGGREGEREGGEKR